jgi:hypothetical protein
MLKENLATEPLFFVRLNTIFFYLWIFLYQKYHFYGNFI